MDISMLAGPLVGAVIGYFTNYIAVKMLFRPHHEVKIGGWTLPMTPGVIPKGKARLARAIGKAVSENLLTKEDMSRYLLNEGTTNLVVDKVVDILNQDIKDDVIMISGTTEEDYREKRDKAIHAVCNYITDEIRKIPLKEKITGAIMEVGKEKIDDLAKEGGMMAMIPLVLTNDKLEDLAGPMGWKAEKYIEEHAYDYIQPLFHERIGELEGECIMDLLNRFGLEDDRIRREIESMYVSIVDDNIGKVMGYLDIATLIEDKINGMSVEELETLVLSVMKNELSMIVRLGAVIGFIIGIVNVFI